MLGADENSKGGAREVYLPDLGAGKSEACGWLKVSNSVSNQAALTLII